MLVHRWIKMVVALLVAVAVVAALEPSIFTGAAPDAQDFSATIQPIGGLVQQLAAGQQTWATLTKVGLLHAGDQIRTGAKGTAQVSTVTGIHMQVFPNTLLELKSLSLGTGNNAELQFVMTEISGLTYTTVDQALKPGDNVQVISPSSTSTIHGTKWYTFVDRNGDTAYV